jgi:alginate O-acetyltransferase complex protein AlgI
VAWPGIDAGRFLGAGRNAEPVSTREALRAFACVALGAALIWGVARLGARAEPILGGWLGMWGIVLLLHFGALRLLSILWRSAGIDARPVMREPVRAASLAEFWGSRWNTAFRDAARRLVFTPVARRLGSTAGAVAAFLASGLAHELVISVPARGGYGLPTAYFLLQGAAVLFERTRVARKLRLGQGWRGRAFTGVVALVPAFWLFPPRFVERVTLPMLAALGAT